MHRLPLALEGASRAGSTTNATRNTTTAATISYTYNVQRFTTATPLSLYALYSADPPAPISAPLPAEENGFVALGIKFAVVGPCLVFYRASGDRVTISGVLRSRQDALGALLE